MTADEILDVSPMFEPLTIRTMTLRNRFIMPGMQRTWCRDGRPVPHLVEYYRRRAAGGTALVITETLAVPHPTSTQVPEYGWIREDTIDGWKECIDAVKSEGGEFFLQLWHEGAIRSVGGDGPLSQYPTLSPSGLAGPDKPNGRAATLEELAEIKEAFVQGALLAKRAGASGVEVHCCHGYLLDQFLWKETNRRTDGYGGDDMRDRVRFPAEIVAAVREAVGDDLVVSVRISQWKEVDYDAKVAETPAELEVLVRAFETAGADMLHVSTRRFWLPEWEGSDLGLAGWVKSMTRLPVAAVGSVGLDVDVMSNLLGEEAHATGIPSFLEMTRRFDRGDFDLMSVGRGQIGDPDWVEKVRRGDIAGIRPFTRDDVLRDLEIPSLVVDAHR